MTTSDTSTPVRPVLSLADLEAFDPQAASGGTERVSRCPHCQSTERAFHFNTITGLYNCKRASCGVSGKLSDFWQERPKQSRRERARNALHSAFGLQNPRSASMPAKAAQHEKLAQPATAQTWQEYFGQARPANGTAAIQYLMQRGIPDTITESAGARFLSIRGRDFVVFPFCNLAGAPVAFQARALDSKANPHRAYGRKRAGVFLTCADALQAETVIVCEAPIDAMSLAACGYPAIALGGTVMPEWLPKALAFKRILLAFDNDTNGAGDKAATDIKPALYSFGAKTARLAPQRMLDAPKSDWNTMLQASGVKALRAWLVCRLAHLEFLGSR